jgi:hypothetical protein
MSMRDIDHTIFVYKNKTSDEISCKFLDETKLIDLKQYEHIGTLNPRSFIQFWWEEIEKLKKEMEEKKE